MRLIRGIVRFFDRKIILPVTKFFVNIGKLVICTIKTIDHIIIDAIIKWMPFFCFLLQSFFNSSKLILTSPLKITINLTYLL